MKIAYKTEHVEKLCTDEVYARRNLPNEIAKRLRLLIPKIIAADNLAFFLLPENMKYHLEKLHGQRQYQMSIRIKYNEGYRMIFECMNTDIKDDYVNMNEIKIIDINKHNY